MVVGGGGAGKTSAINAFTGKKINPQNQAESTCGIEQHILTAENNTSVVMVQQQQWKTKESGESELQVRFVYVLNRLL